MLSVPELGLPTEVDPERGSRRWGSPAHARIHVSWYEGREERRDARQERARQTCCIGRVSSPLSSVGAAARRLLQERGWVEGVQCRRRTNLMDARRALWRMPKTAHSENEYV